jgi:hypothetical protein
VEVNQQTKAVRVERMYWDADGPKWATFCRACSTPERKIRIEVPAPLDEETKALGTCPACKAEVVLDLSLTPWIKP